MDNTVTSTEFQGSPGKYFELSGSDPLIITRNGRPHRVLVDVRYFAFLEEHAPKAMRMSDALDAFPWFRDQIFSPNAKAKSALRELVNDPDALEGLDDDEIAKLRRLAAADD